MADRGGGRIDTLFDGMLKLRQPARGHRAGTDAVLLAAAAAPCPGEIVVDVGSGAGTVGLALALRHPDIAVRLLERDPLMAAYARDNAALNGVAARVGVAESDLFEDRPTPAGDADLLVSNPPFYAAGRVRGSPNPLKADAHVFAPAVGPGGEGLWLRAMLRLAGPHARVILIHRPEALASLLAAAEGRVGGIRVRPVYAAEGRAAIRILFGGIVASRAPLSLLAPLVLHDPSGRFTPLVEAVHRGAATIPLMEATTRKSRPQGPAPSPMTDVTDQQTRTRCGP